MKGMDMQVKPRDEAPVVPRALMAAVIGMGIAIVVGVAVLIGVIVHRMGSGHGVSAPVVVGRGQGENVRLAVPGGMRVTGMTARADGSVVVSLRGDAGERVVIWDPVGGRIVATLALPGAGLPGAGAPEGEVSPR